MVPDELRGFLGAAAEFTDTLSRIEALQSENESHWQRNGWTAAYDLYFSRRKMIETGFSDADKAMQDLYPQEYAAYAGIRDHSAAFAAERNRLALQAAKLRSEALSRLGAAMSTKLVDAFMAGEPDFDAAVEPLYKEATAYRMAHLDGRPLPYVSETGPFTEALLKPVAKLMGLETSRSGWTGHTREAFNQRAIAPVL